ncbi:MAG: class II fumarate hydratase [Burkholderiales bacterium]|nr:class II fumarate hydratase [Burkholderiales bacterium]
MSNAATRTEHDSFGPIEVPADALWGAQTERSRRFFAIGAQRMPLALVHAIALVKWAAALANAELGRIDAVKAAAIAAAALRVAEGEFDAQFPLSLWQTGSGTQTHMNVNEVVAHLASASLAPDKVHPNDDVNLGQSSNDVFPTAMHIAATRQLHDLEAALDALCAALRLQAARHADIVKVGRTHLQDATPLTLGQEFGGYVAQLELVQRAIAQATPDVRALAIGATAVGTGLNTHPRFGERVCELLSRHLDEDFRQAGNLFAALAGHEPLVRLHGALRGLAIVLAKIGNDLRLMGSGPRAGLGELQLPENEPGSSIMPGKVNPTQIEALAMVCAQVMGHDVAIGIAASQGQFELNVYKPLIAYDTLDSLRLLGDAMRSFTVHCVQGLQPHVEHLQAGLERSLMRVTALTPHIGYERAARIARLAHAQGLSLREAALREGGVRGEDFDVWTDPRRMLAPDAEADADGVAPRASNRS